jgi:uncharacterized protein (DUF1499 family)
MDGLLLVLTLVVIHGGGPQEAPGGETQTPEQLADCPGKPNCVSSEASGGKHAVEPLRLKGEPSAAWESLRAVVTRLPRCEVVRSTGRYLHVICKSRIFGFVDDLELLWESPSDRVAIRSASRTGYADLGVNRKRIETLRRQLKTANVIH